MVSDVELTSSGHASACSTNGAIDVGSGKSTYLKQIAIITIMAHCGCYVTAESAVIPLRDRICCRIGNIDDQEHSISTFMLEMRETAFICNNATSRSLILIDELGRATSNEDGVAIAWATSEYLLKKRALTFFVTHYPQLTTLASIYPSVQNIHLAATISHGPTSEIRYAHKAKPGACSVSTDYGIEMAGACGWPMETVNHARSVQQHIEELLPDEGLCSVDQVSNDRTEAYKVLETISDSLRGLMRHDGAQSYATIRAQVHALQEEHLVRSHHNGGGIVSAMHQLVANRRSRAWRRAKSTEHDDTVMSDDFGSLPDGETLTTLETHFRPRRVTASPVAAPHGRDTDNSSSNMSSSSSGDDSSDETSTLDSSDQE
jgi:MutS domain V